MESGAVSRIRRRLARPLPLVQYLLLTTETHAFCAALAFFALVGFYPFSSLLLSLSRYWLEWGPAQNVVLQTLKEYYPEGQAFLLRNLEASVEQYGRGMQIPSVFWILLGAAGFFIPLETAFNRLWGAPEHRSYWRNQRVGLLLTSACCILAVGFVLLTAGAHWIVARLVPIGVVANALRHLALRLAALGFSVAAIFLFYRFLPNCRVRGADVFPAALGAGLVAELVRWAYLVILPWLQLPKSQGPYYISISFVLLAYVEAFVLLGGAFFAAERDEEPVAPEAVPARAEEEPPAPGDNGATDQPSVK